MNRTPLLSVLAGALLLPACDDMDAEYRQAPPSPEEVTVPVPAGGGRTSASTMSSGVLEQAITGQHSEYYQMTYDTSSGINAGAVGMLAMIRDIASHPATSRTQNSRTWGPFTPGGLEPLTFRAVITKMALNTFHFSLEGRPRASQIDTDFLPIVDGDVVRDNGSPGLVGGGKGTMAVHWANQRKLVPTLCDQGTVRFDFDDTVEPARLDVTFTQVGSDNPANQACKQESARDAHYHFDQTRAGAGNFVFEMHGSIHKPEENKPAPEHILVRSRWQADGAGRADLMIEGGEVAVDVKNAGGMQDYVTGSQCWDTGFATVYETSTPEMVKILPTDGKAAACAYTEAMLPQ